MLENCKDEVVQQRQSKQSVLFDSMNNLHGLHKRLESLKDKIGLTCSPISEAKAPEKPRTPSLIELLDSLPDDIRIQCDQMHACIDEIEQALF